MSVSLNDVVVENPETPVNVVEFAHANGVEVPTLCFLKDCGNVAKCGLCSVKVNGKRALACNTIVADGDEIVTSDEELDAFHQKRIAGLLANHDFSCGKCIRRENCEFLKLVIKTKAKAEVRYEAKPELIDARSTTLKLDRNKCVLCSRCVATCAFKTTTESLTVAKADADAPEGSLAKSRHISPALKGVSSAGTPARDEAPVPSELCLDDTNCLLCGQCTLACPVGALTEQDDTAKVAEALQDPDKFVVFAPAPAVRASLGEMFGEGYGFDATGKIYDAARKLGFDKVWDINFAADVTIVEEGTELLQRLGLAEGGHSSTLPMFTSCCPGWMRLVNNYKPELLPHVSTTKSPQEIFSAAVKAYLPIVDPSIKPENIVVVTIMPCTAKKYEATLYGNTDLVLTIREFGRFIKSNKLVWAELDNDAVADPAMGEYTGAGTIFGITGGVMEAAIRSAKDIAEGADLTEVDYEAVEGFDGIRSATVNVAGVDLKVAVINGAANAFKFFEEGSLDDFHFIEVMACPGGCIGGGGHPQVSSHDQLNQTCPVSGKAAGFVGCLPDHIAARASVLRTQDKDGKYTDKFRKSHKNPSVLAMYETLGAAPGAGVAHDLFHVGTTGAPANYASATH